MCIIVPIGKASDELINELLCHYSKERNNYLLDSNWEGEAGIKKVLKTGEQQGFMALVKKRPAGFLLFKEAKGSVFITHFYTGTGSQGGTGSKLIEQLLHYVSSKITIRRITGALFPRLVDLGEEDLIRYGFKAYDRFVMEKALTEDMAPALLANDFTLSVAHQKYHWQLAETLHASSQDLIDGEMRPGIFDSPWTCFLFLKQIMSGHYGFFNFNSSFLILKGTRVAGAILGTCKISGEGFIPAFFVDPKYQGRGLGKVLLTALMNKLRECGIKKISLCVTRQNEKACSLYEKSAFNIAVQYYEIVYDAPLSL